MNPEPRQRRQWIDGFARRILEQESAFAETVGRELDRDPWEVFMEEIEPLLAACRWHRRRGLAMLAPRALSGRAWWQFGQRHRAFFVPRGTVAIIATWNYPVQLLGIQLVQAVTAGNRVVVKPSELAPGSQALLLRCAVEAAVDAGLGADWIRSVEATREAGRRLLESERFDFVVFTGSTEVGRQVAKACAATLTPSALELSGRDSAIVLDDADARLAARSIWHGVTMNGGQTCMAPRRAIVTRRIEREFMSALLPLAAAARPRGLVSAEAAERVMSLVRDALDRGARSITGVVEPPTDPERRRLRPLALVECPGDAPIVEGRHFGPVLAVVAADDERAAVELHQRCDQRLATSVYTSSVRRWLDPARIAELGSGVVTINDTIIPTGHPGAPLSGTGDSGWSVTRGASGLRALAREVIVSATNPRFRVPIDPPSESGQRWLRSVARWLTIRGRGGST